MDKKIDFKKAEGNDKEPRIGGAALLGGIFEWPMTPENVPLTLLMSLPTEFLNKYSGTSLPANKFVSIFSFYSQEDYFLEYITYHGDPAELALLKRGYTRVLLHDAGSHVSKGSEIPTMSIVVDDTEAADINEFQGSKIGICPCLLQNEKIALENQQYVMQIYGGAFPKPFQDILYLSDAVGYLYIDPNPATIEQCVDAGTFFVQAT